MQTCILVLGVLLTGQLSDASGLRYPPVTPTTDNNAPLADALPTERQPAERQPFAEQSPAAQPLPPRVNPLRTAAPAVEAAPLRTAPANNIPAIKNEELFRTLVKPVGAATLSGMPLSLAEAVQNTRSRREQTGRVRTYWKLSQAVSEYFLASKEVVELQSLRNNITQPSREWLKTQQAAMDRKKIAAEALEVVQLRLQAELGRQSQALLPLPSDLPFCGVYESRYSQIFQGRSSREAKQLSDLLPLRHIELGRQAANTLEAHDFLTLADQQRSPQSDGTQLLRAYEQLALQRRVFVMTAYQYNSHIADYTELAVPQDVATARLVSMLIKTDGSFVQDWNRGSIRRTSADEPVAKSAPSDGRPRTFASEGRNERRRVPVGDTDSEHSIMVDPPAYDKR